MPTEFEDQLAIFKAAKEGKTIEYYDYFVSRWIEISDGEYKFNFWGLTYRIKPEKPKILHQYLIRNRRGDLYATGRFFQSEDECRKEFPLTTVIECLHYTRIEVSE